jgi:enoyl-CoA hydratase/carnithine racemase
VCAVNGAAIGAGLDLTCMCDIRISSSAAKFGSTFVRLGLVPGDGGAYFLGRTVGFARALELMLTGRVIDADEALAIGLVHRVVAPEKLLDEACAVAESIAEHPPVAVQLTKRAAYRGYDGDLEAALEMAATYQGIAQTTEDHRNAVAAMLRKP